MKWKQELLWVKRNEKGVAILAIRVEEQRPQGVPDDQFYEEDELNDKVIETTRQFGD